MWLSRPPFIPDGLTVNPPICHSPSGMDFPEWFCDNLLQSVGYPASCHIDDIRSGSITVLATIVFTQLTIEMEFDLDEDDGLMTPDQLSDQLKEDAANLFSSSFLKTFGPPQDVIDVIIIFPPPPPASDSPPPSPTSLPPLPPSSPPVPSPPTTPTIVGGIPIAVSAYLVFGPEAKLLEGDAEDSEARAARWRNATVEAVNAFAGKGLFVDGRPVVEVLSNTEATIEIALLAANEADAARWGRYRPGGRWFTPITSPPHDVLTFVCYFVL